MGVSELNPAIEDVLSSVVLGELFYEFVNALEMWLIKLIGI